ncbi:hypothetical protein I600_2416 [Maribacter dokdonensis DSW-8]|nr:hypothetical protein I600_2416 [Maribacter dokdonensis DSW-8]
MVIGARSLLILAYSPVGMVSPFNIDPGYMTSVVGSNVNNSLKPGAPLNVWVKHSNSVVPSRSGLVEAVSTILDSSGWLNPLRLATAELKSSASLLENFGELGSSGSTSSLLHPTKVNNIVLNNSTLMVLKFK